MRRADHLDIGFTEVNQKDRSWGQSISIRVYRFDICGDVIGSMVDMESS
jgi:hypothetical protein